MLVLRNDELLASTITHTEGHPLSVVYDCLFGTDGCRNPAMPWSKAANIKKTLKRHFTMSWRLRLLLYVWPGRCDRLCRRSPTDAVVRFREVRRNSNLTPRRNSAHIHTHTHPYTHTHPHTHTHTNKGHLKKRKVKVRVKGKVQPTTGHEGLEVE